VLVVLSVLVQFELVDPRSLGSFGYYSTLRRRYQGLDYILIG
jgi:hypothetical protein